jgi:hypothetical protein
MVAPINYYYCIETKEIDNFYDNLTKSLVKHGCEPDTITRDKLNKFILKYQREVLSGLQDRVAGLYQIQEIKSSIERIVDDYRNIDRYISSDAGAKYIILRQNLAAANIAAQQVLKNYFPKKTWTWASVDQSDIPPNDIDIFFNELDKTSEYTGTGV